MKRFLSVICTILAIGLISCNEPESPPVIDTSIKSLGTPADNEIWFTTIDKRELMALNEEAFSSTILDIEYSEVDVNVIRFAEPLTAIGAGAFDNCRNINNISLPEGVTTIAERAFFECIQLECITFGSKIKKCGFQAFDGCNSLYSIHVASVGYWCNIEFANPTANPIYHSGSFLVNGKKVTNLSIPKWVEHIGDYAFYNCSTLSSVALPASIKSIGKDAFYGCEALSKVDIESVGAWCQVELANAFSNPLSIAGTLYESGQPAIILTIKGVETINKGVFQGCKNIKAVIATNSLKSIGEEAFRGCAELISVELHSGIKSIGGGAFMGCLALKNVAIMASEPPVLGDQYVFEYNAEGRKIYIPESAFDAYVTDPMWSKYADSFETLLN